MKKYYPHFAVISLCLIVGGALLYAYYIPSIVYHEEDYTECQDEDANYNVTCRDMLDTKETCLCFWTFKLDKDIPGEVFLSYKLKGYVFDKEENIKKYLLSRDSKQLAGDLSNIPSEACGEYRYNGDIPIAPCGAVANYMFNDTFSINMHDFVVPIRKNNLVPSNVKEKYRNPPGNLETALANFSKPADWNKNVWQLGSEDGDKAFQNEDFIIWMERSPGDDVQTLPLYGRLDAADTDGGLTPGTFVLQIYYNYVVPPNATKILVLWNKTYNNTLHVFACIFFVLAGVILLILIYYKYIAPKIHPPKDKNALWAKQYRRMTSSRDGNKKRVIYFGDSTIVHNDTRWLVIHAGEENAFLSTKPLVLRTGENYHKPEECLIIKWLQDEMLPTIGPESCVIAVEDDPEVNTHDTCNYVFLREMYRLLPKTVPLNQCAGSGETPSGCLMHGFLGSNHKVLPIRDMFRDWNPCRYIMKIVKAKVEPNIVIGDDTEIESLIESAVSSITEEDWKISMNSVEERLNEYFNGDNVGLGLARLL